MVTNIIEVTSGASISLLIQTIAYFLLIIGIGFAKKQNFSKHGIIMVVSTLLMSTSLFTVMVQVFYSMIFSNSFTILSSTTIVITHHLLGIITLLMAVVSILVLRPCGSVMGNKKLGNVRKYMISLFILWSITYILGIVIYWMFYF